MRTLVLTLSALGALLALAAPAGAVTTITATATASDVAVSAAAGVANEVTVGAGGAPDTVRISDTANAIDTLAATSCTIAPDGHSADCPLPGTVTVDLGDGDDTLSAVGAPVAVEVDGGAGADHIVAGPRSDRVTGGAGADTVDVGGGDDVVRLRDTETDVVSCGDGADDAADADAQDALTACEETPATAGPPDTSIVAGNPAPSTRDRTASFTFGATEPVARYECSLDGAMYATCPASRTYTGLADGAHTLLVRAVDLIGNTDAVPAAYVWAVDTVAPTVTISGKPDPATNRTTADFTFNGGDPAATVQCRLDGAAWGACDAPTADHHTGLAEGTHTFAVRSADAAANVGTASFTWRVDLTAPSASFTAAPAVLSNDTTPAFRIAVSETATHACSIDGGDFAACSASPTLPALTDGAHTLQVRSTDVAGNSGLIAYAWTLDSVRPQTTLTSGPATSAPVTSASATLTFASPGAAAFECALDGAAWARCASPVTYTGLADGAHSFAVRAVDAAGNVDGTPATRAWTVRADEAPTARIGVTRDGDGLALSAAGSTDPEGGRLTYRWQGNGQASGSVAAIHYAAPDRETRDVFTLTVTDPGGNRGQATVALRTRAVGETAAHEAMEVIRFGSGRRLARGANARIAALRASVANGGARVRIDGYASAPRGAAALSKARAQTVRALLARGAGAGAQFTVVARGTAAPAASNRTAAGRARNDRVVVSVSWQGPAEHLVTEQEGDAAVRRTTAPQAVAPGAGRALKLFAFYSAVPGALKRLEEVGGRVDVLAPNWYTLAPSSAAISGGAPNAKVMALSRRLRFAVWPVVNATMHGSALIDSASGRAKVVKRIGALAARHRLAGVTLDMEEMLPSQRASFSALVAQLASALHANHRRLAVYAVRRTATDVDDGAAAYDWAALARSADLVLASGYNEHSATTPPGPITTQAGFDALAGYAAATSTAKVAPAMGAFGYRWSGAGARMLSSAEAERRSPVRAEVGSADGRSAASGSTYFESAEDLWARERAASRAGAKWIALFTLGREPERFWERSLVR
jgi:hypothetical protein